MSEHTYTYSESCCTVVAVADEDDTDRLAGEMSKDLSDDARDDDGDDGDVDEDISSMDDGNERQPSSHVD
jgi:hypothetical protein